MAAIFGDHYVPLMQPPGVLPEGSHFPVAKLDLTVNIAFGKWN